AFDLVLLGRCALVRELEDHLVAIRFRLGGEHLLLHDPARLVLTGEDDTDEDACGRCASEGRKRERQRRSSCGPAPMPEAAMSCGPCHVVTLGHPRVDVELNRHVLSVAGKNGSAAFTRT